ncbi:MAG TPA: hypothetical protein VJ792_01385 [Candidatus Nitrosotalea sp.]|nr:hypothetical protein [Candidatus Nitrosotalea sp.]
MSLADELWTLLEGQRGTATRIEERHYRFTPNDNVCTVDITFDNEVIRISGRSNDFDDEVSVSIRNPKERLIERFDLALNAVLIPMRDLHNLMDL